MSTYLVLPMFALVFFTWSLTFVIFRTRVRAVKSGEIDFRYFKAYQGEIPERLVVVGRHFDNQFQLPVLFYVACLAHMNVGVTNTITLVLAVLFVVARLAHTYVHLGHNKPLVRAKVYFVGWLINMLLWFQLCYFVVVK